MPTDSRNLAGQTWRLSCNSQTPPWPRAKPDSIGSIRAGRNDVWPSIAVELDPEAAALDEGRRFPICRPDALQALFLGAGLDDVRCDAIAVPTRFASFDDYWQPFLGGTGPAPAHVAGLVPERRDALVTVLRRMLGDADGEIDLQARAWVVRGRAPV